MFLAKVHLYWHNFRPFFFILQFSLQLWVSLNLLVRSRVLYTAFSRTRTQSRATQLISIIINSWRYYKQYLISGVCNMYSAFRWPPPPPLFVFFFFFFFSFCIFFFFFFWYNFDKGYFGSIFSNSISAHTSGWKWGYANATAINPNIEKLS